jgi:hypothetical protein
LQEITPSETNPHTGMDLQISAFWLRHGPSLAIAHVSRGGLRVSPVLATCELRAT